MDYIDLYYVHVWDVVTPVEEVVSTLTDLIREGKIRYYGFSDTPAWYAARAQTLAQNGAKEPVTTLQLEYSLVERSIEREHIPAAQELGMGICPWSPLASGMLTGKYKREGTGEQTAGRLANPSSTPFPRFTEKNWRVIDVVVEVAKQINKTPAQVALNWVVTQPGVTSTILGTTKVAQLDDNLGALDFVIPSELRKRLDEVSAPETIHPYTFFTAPFQSMMTGGTSVEPWQPAQVYDRTAVAPAVRRNVATTGEK
jgi:aryl-alcohol dehydrogenase-like predicted oxidoreductase